MDYIASVFDSKSKCKKCSRGFKLTSKRRKCVICGFIFCKNCSVKVKFPGAFKSKRYCVDCKTSEDRKEEPKKIEENLVSVEESMASLQISEEEIKNNRQSISDIITTYTTGVKRLPHTSSVFPI